MRVRLGTLWVVVVALLAGGIVAAVSKSSDGPSDATGTLPGGPLGERIQWVLAYVNTGAGAGDLSSTFTESLLAAVSPAQFVEVTETQVRPNGTLRVERVEEAEQHLATLLVRGETGAALTMHIAIEDQTPNRISGLRFAGAPAAEPAPASLPKGAIGDQAKWVLSVINGETPLDADSYAQHFNAAFVAQVSLPMFEQVLATQLRPGGTFTVERHLAPITSTALAAVVRGTAGTRLSLQLAIEASEPHRISGLLFSAAPSEELPASWDELGARLEETAPEVAFLAAEVTSDNQCIPVHSLDGDTVLALGSVFKLYVLAALAQSVEAGQARWDQPIEIRDEARVHSSPRYGATPTGTPAALRDLAQAMIEVSDNTATDLVMSAVGRPTIEAALAPNGMAAPEHNTPFLTTREVSLLKWSVSPDERSRYLGVDPAERRRYLEAELPATAATERELVVSPKPVAVDAIEWFASPADLCRAHVSLQELAKRPGLGPVRDILSRNPGAGVPIDKSVWPYVAFKGGSEPGVLGLSWYLERHDGRRFAVTALLRNTGGSISSFVALDVAAAFDLLASH